MSTASSRPLSVLSLLLLVAAVLFAAPVAPAQGVCTGPDGLTGPCCAVVQPNLPPFPQVATGGLGICWNNCTVAATNNLRVVWNPPALTNCTSYTTNVTVFDGATGIALMAGPMVLDYTRTWDETDPAGIQHQVYRFTAKADLTSVLPAGMLPPCPMPRCLPPGGTQPTAFFYGYADYACDPTDPTAPFDPVLVLYHACDRFIHRPGFSDRPGTFHPTESYAIVAPHTAAQPFTPANTLAPGGVLTGEAIRDLPTGPICLAEEPVVSGDMIQAATGCVCNLSTATVHHTLRIFKGSTACVNPVGVPGGFASLAINFPVNPWYHLVTSSIGFWSTPGLYPGNERCWVDEGVFVHQSACTGDWAEIKYGGTTRAGWTPILPTPVPSNKFTDLADNYTAPLTGPFATPILGSIRPTEHLIYVNY